MSSGLMLANCCCEGCSNLTGCTGDFVLTTCTGEKVIVPSPTYSYSYASGWTTPDTTYYMTYLGGRRSLSIQCDLDFSKPLLSDFDLKAQSVRGVYRRYVRNGSTYTFDGTYGCGTAFAPAEDEDDAAIPTGPVPGFPYSPPGGDYFVSVIDTVVVTETFDSVHDNSDGVLNASATYSLSKVYLDHRNGVYYDTAGVRNGTTGVPDGYPGPPGGYWDATYKVISPTKSITKSISVDTSASDICGGDTLTAGIEDTGSYSTHLTAAEDFDDTNTVCRDCPRVLDLSGTIWVDCDPSTGEPGYEPGFDDPAAEIREATIEGRLVMPLVSQCGRYTCDWAGTATVSRSGTDVSASVTVTREGPRLFRIDIGITSISEALSLYYTTTDSCPTAIDEIEQKPTPYTLDQISRGFEYNGAPYGMGETFDIEYNQADPSIDPFTSHAFTLTSGTLTGDDPTYYCDEDCASAADDYLLDIDCGGGYPSGWSDPIELVRGDAPCTWVGDNGTYNAELSYDAGTGLWSLTITRNSDSVVVFTAIPWAGSSNDPSGSHGYDGSTFDEDPCNMGGIFAVIS